jgi:hypothetical protein
MSARHIQMESVTCTQPAPTQSDHLCAVHVLHFSLDWETKLVTVRRKGNRGRRRGIGEERRGEERRGEERRGEEMRGDEMR